MHIYLHIENLKALIISISPITHKTQEIVLNIIDEIKPLIFDYILYSYTITKKTNVIKNLQCNSRQKALCDLERNYNHK